MSQLTINSSMDPIPFSSLTLLLFTVSFFLLQLTMLLQCSDSKSKHPSSNKVNKYQSGQSIDLKSPVVKPSEVKQSDYVISMTESKRDDPKLTKAAPSDKNLTVNKDFLNTTALMSQCPPEKQSAEPAKKSDEPEKQSKEPMKKPAEPAKKPAEPIKQSDKQVKKSDKQTKQNDDVKQVVPAKNVNQNVPKANNKSQVAKGPRVAPNPTTSSSDRSNKKAAKKVKSKEGEEEDSFAKHKPEVKKANRAEEISKKGPIKSHRPEYKTLDNLAKTSFDQSV